MALTGNFLVLATAGTVLLGSFALNQIPAVTASNITQASPAQTATAIEAIADQPVRGCPVGGGCGTLPFGKVAAFGKDVLVFASNAAWNCIGDITGWTSGDTGTGS